jgi:putative nucleotidyltransferase with HDIG domain
METDLAMGEATPGPDLEAAVRELLRSQAVPISPYPGVALRLQKLVASQSYGTQDLVKIAGAEPVVVSQLLFSANSSAFAGGGRVASLADAVSRLGGDEVVRIAIAACLGADAGKRGPLASVRRRIWQEAITGALLCAQIAQARGLNKDVGFVCGLLHDIGRVVAAGAVEVVLDKHKDGRSLPEMEWLGIIDRLHVEMGVMVASQWTLPAEVRAAVAEHHRPPGNGAHEPMVGVVRVIDQIVGLLMTQPQVTEAQLGALGTLSRSEITMLNAAIPKVGPLVASLSEIPPAGPEARSQVQAAPRQAKSASIDINFPLSILRNQKQVPGRCSRVTWSSIGATLKEPLLESFLCKLRLEPQGIPPFEVHARVVRCAPVTGGYDIEGQLFALGGAAKDAWEKLVKNVGGEKT